MQRTQHIESLYPWDRAPLPFFEIARGIGERDASLPTRVFGLLETTLELALAFGIAAVRQHSPERVLEILSSDFSRPTLGTRKELVNQLDRLDPGVCGWNLKRRDKEAASLASAFDAGSTVKNIGGLIDRLIAARNDLAHNGLSSEELADFAFQVLPAIKFVVSKNSFFVGSKLIRVDNYTALGGRPGLVGTCFSGAAAAKYAMGQPFVGPALAPGTVISRSMNGDVLDLSPFIEVRGDAVYFLSAWNRNRGFLRTPRFPKAPLEVDFLKPVPGHPGTGARLVHEVRPPRSPRHAKALGAAAGLILVAAAVFGAVVVTSQGDGSQAAEPGRSGAAMFVENSATQPPIPNPELSAPILEPPTTSCGRDDAKPRVRAAALDWPKWSCRTKESTATELWASCLSQYRYVPTGGSGCPGEARCCPPDVHSAIRQEEAIRPLLPSLCGFDRADRASDIDNWQRYRCRSAEQVSPRTWVLCLGREQYSSRVGTGCVEGMLCCPEQGP